MFPVIKPWGTFVHCLHGDTHRERNGSNFLRETYLGNNCLVRASSHKSHPILWMTWMLVLTVNRIKQETGVFIRFPDGEAINKILIEGSREGVKRAVKDLRELVEKIQNEKERDIIIPQRFHPKIIGSKGENIRETRDRFNNVQITFPAPGEWPLYIGLFPDFSQVSICSLKASNFWENVCFTLPIHSQVACKFSQHYLYLLRIPKSQLSTFFRFLSSKPLHYWHENTVFNINLISTFVFWSHR